ncbi:hypothetical protein BDY21DRAFT_277431 [Lineolata rhizophorae]|uniref:Protein BNI4 n=1 Tax=Lineolata rhizophorae TaxID=578093 RepID=A0A6A6PDB7_9PEZI|nr:hypothetical protein BDY21DRAFT_277431 [Lineolata rhizophorae]
MAEVLAPLVQQPSTITMLHPSTDALQTNAAPQPNTQPSRASQAQGRAHGYASSPSGGMGYRGTAATPVAPYAFQSTPHLRQDQRSASAPVAPFNPRAAVAAAPPSSSASNSSTASSGRSGPSHQFASQDDLVLDSVHRRSAVGSNFDSRLSSSVSLSTSVPDLSLTTLDAPPKAHPDRYRRAVRRTDAGNPTNSSAQQSAAPSGSGMAAVAHLYKGAPAGTAPSRTGHLRTSSADDTYLPRQGALEQAKRYRRRSISSIDASTLAGAAPMTSSMVPDQQPNKSTNNSVRPSLGHKRQDSGESRSSSSSGHRPSSANAGTPRNATAQPVLAATRNDSKTANVPSRATPDSNKRPSPLSQSAFENDDELSTKGDTRPGSSAAPPSPAVQHLAALSDKDLNKGMKSRLRRAFSFGSSAELRRASAANNLSTSDRQKLHKDRPAEDAQTAEDEEIAARQEAAGIGNSIYSGQGNVFTGSTDNLSISSTASSASVMLRKMGKGMKKGTRSIKGLFRPKSVVGVPSLDSSAVTQPSVAQVSMVTVEAEREKVNVNPHPQDQAGGGTGFPKLERNSIDAASRPSTEQQSSSIGNAASSEASGPRRSIVGGDEERAKVLAAVRKGILKRSGTSSGNSSPVTHPVDAKPPAAEGSLDTPHSSAPSTPDDQPRAMPVKFHSSDESYFVGMSRLSGSTKSLPNTPVRNISFSPRIQFHDVWSSTEYDRRGEIATCNRLTPMLAQQIKEELNSFKMEMEVHELSKPHTHFF